MRLIPLTSGHLASIGYNPDAKRLVVQFHTGKFYQYEGVDPGTFVAIITDPASQGKALL